LNVSGAGGGADARISTRSGSSGSTTTSSKSSVGVGKPAPTNVVSSAWIVSKPRNAMLDATGTGRTTKIKKIDSRRFLEHIEKLSLKHESFFLLFSSGSTGGSSLQT